MAQFDVLEDEGMRLLKITIGDEAVRAEAGALSYLRGAIEVDVPLPSLGRAIGNILSDEPLIRPRYMGTGEIFLTPSLGGYHVLDVAEQAWILEDGAYWGRTAASIWGCTASGCSPRSGPARVSSTSRPV